VQSRPSKIALLLGKKVGVNKIRDYLLKRYGITPPDDWLFLTQTNKFIVIRTDNDTMDNKLTDEDKSQGELQKKEFDHKLSDNKKIHAQLTKWLARAQDPMEPLVASMLRAINNVDLATIDEIQKVIINKSGEFINHYKENEQQKEWGPDLDIIPKFLNYLVDIFRTYLNMSERQKLDSTKISILETSYVIAGQVISANPGHINVFLNLWKETADSEIGKSRLVFNRIIELYQRLLKWVFENGITNNERWTDDIFRHLGWLTERLITRIGIEQKPLMRDYDYSNEYDQIFETLFTCSQAYKNRYPETYPLIFFDFVDVLFLQLVSTAKNNSDQKLRENIFECLYVYFEFAEAAISKSNSRGAALATTRLSASYDKVYSEGLKESAAEGIGLLVRLGLAAFDHKDKLEIVDFLSYKSIAEHIMDKVSQSQLRNKVEESVRDAYLHSDYEKSKWSYVLEMGKRLETNFGFMFDWNTGEYYADNDPRRR